MERIRGDTESMSIADLMKELITENKRLLLENEKLKQEIEAIKKAVTAGTDNGKK